MQTQMSEKLKMLAGIVEKFVEHNFFEKEQRDENLRKLALAFETFVRENRLVRDGSSLLRETSFVRDNPLLRDLRNSLKTQRSGLIKVPVKVKTLPNFKGELPKYQTALASGFDVRAQLEKPVEIAPGQRALIPTGLSFAIPEGYEIQSRPRSGWAIRDGITVLNSPGTIDADYRGEVKIIVINHGENAVIIQDQDRVAQLVLAPVVQAQLEVVEDLDATERGAGGFGSTGRE